MPSVYPAKRVQPGQRGLLAMRVLPKCPTTRLVKFFTIVGDISDDNNCNDDTWIVGIEFAPVRVEFATNQN